MHSIVRKSIVVEGMKINILSAQIWVYWNKKTPLNMNRMIEVKLRCAKKSLNNRGDWVLI